MLNERTVELSIENGVLVVECLKFLRIIPTKDSELSVYVDNKSDKFLAFSGAKTLVDYFLDIEPRYGFISKFNTPKSVKTIHGMVNISVEPGEGCLLTLPKSKENVFVYNESGLLCFRGPSKIIDKETLQVFFG